ncbi:uncharacterized protein LOC111313649 [Durio zibethinus]|uniref:Uncharacterized protein LOC111313649 n=1 Tax=Durio zibethinus TaxID=66656 RepID=A0A6P6AYW0_DURZI|nr:uncharacterized protein LOC111313649 [Durio zibethinus]
MHPGRMWNGESRSIDRLGAWIDAGNDGGPSLGFRCARGDIVVVIVERSTHRLDMPRH